MNICYLSLGSNQKSPQRQLRAAIKAIKAIPGTSIIKTSGFYWNKAWGMEAQQDFCNVIVEIITRCPPHLLLRNCQKIEQDQGRIRKTLWGPRTIDIDIILYGDLSVNTSSLKIPHPHMLSRDFVLIPLYEINQNHSVFTDLQFSSDNRNNKI